MVTPLISSLLSRYHRRFKNIQDIFIQEMCVHIYAHTCTFVCIYHIIG